MISQSDIVISVLSGLIGGAIFSISDGIVILLAGKETEITLTVFVRGSIFLSVAIGLLFGLIGGALISTSLLPKEQVSNFMISQAIVLSLVGIIIGIGKVFFYKVRASQDSE